MHVRIDDWFLTATERDNPDARIDKGASAAGWSVGNQVEVLIDGASYFGRLHAVLCSLHRDDWVHFTDWEGDPDERLLGPGTELVTVLSQLASDGVHVRGMLWRSHPSQANFSEQQNLALTKAVNRAGGEILLDERVRRGGSHHQKLFVIRRVTAPDEDVAFVGGIDLCHGRHDDPTHLGDPQAVDLDERYGPNPPWHDAQLEVHGPTVAALADTFRERWEDPTPLDHHNPFRRAPQGHPPTAPSGSTPATARRTRTLRSARGAGPPDLSREVARVPVRAAR